MWQRNAPLLPPWTLRGRPLQQWEAQLLELRREGQLLELHVAAQAGVVVVAAAEAVWTQSRQWGR